MSARAQPASLNAPVDAIALLPALARDVERILRDLPTAELLVLRLRFGIGVRRRSRREVARRLGVGIASVRRLQMRALRDLRALALPRDLPRRRNASDGGLLGRRSRAAAGSHAPHPRDEPAGLVGC